MILFRQLSKDFEHIVDLPVFMGTHVGSAYDRVPPWDRREYSGESEDSSIEQVPGEEVRFILRADENRNDGGF